LDPIGIAAMAAARACSRFHCVTTAPRPHPSLSVRALQPRGRRRAGRGPDAMTITGPCLQGNQRGTVDQLDERNTAAAARRSSSAGRRTPRRRTRPQFKNTYNAKGADSRRSARSTALAMRRCSPIEREGVVFARAYDCAEIPCDHHAYPPLNETRRTFPRTIRPVRSGSRRHFVNCGLSLVAGFPRPVTTHQCRVDPCP
jgi:hypothetical protein